MIRQSLEQFHVLLVEPSVVQHRIIEAMLSELGVKDILWVKQGDSALAALAEHELDLVISAMHLADMTGAELLTAIRADPVSPEIPYILISSETHYRYLEPIRQAGAIALLPKPFVIEQLRRALYATLDYMDPGELRTGNVTHEDLKVLLVDDSALSRRHIARILGSMGIEHISEAENGQQAFALIEQHYYDLIVTDLHMPEMDGEELIARIRQDSDQPSVPILMVSSESDSTRLAVIQQAGVSAMCDKPFEVSAIKHLIEAIID